MQIGQVLMRQKKFEAALDELALALREKPHYPEALVNMGGSHAQRGELEDAVWCWSEALEQDNTVPLAQSNIEALLKNEITRLRTHIALGIFAAQRNRYSEAEKHWRMALQFDPLSVTARENLGLTAEKQGHRLEAINAYREVLQLDPNSQKALDGLKRMEK